MSVVLFVREDLLKATHKELKWIESFTDKHGHVHRGHHKHVLVADDHNNVKVATGQGSFYQKIAHKNAMADIPNFQSLDIDHQANIILHHATGLQAAASASAAVSGFKSSMLAGKVPTPAQYFAIQNATTKAQADVADACAAAIGAEKYEQLLSAASAKANQPKGKTSEPQASQAISQKTEREKAQAGLTHSIGLEAVASKNLSDGGWAGVKMLADAASALSQNKQGLDSLDAATVAAMAEGSHYQKEAVKKLKAEHGPAWDAMHPSKQLDLAHAKYQALQGAASQAAAVSGWKKHMLAGQVPTPSEVKAMAAFDTATPDKALKVMNEVKAVIGMDAYIQLVTQAHAKAAKAPVAVAAKPVEPAKVFVTTPPTLSSGANLAGTNAYKQLMQSEDAGGVNKVKPDAEAWLAANSGKEAELNQALFDLGHASLQVPESGAAAKPKTLADKTAYDHMAQSVSSKMSHSLPAQKTFHKLAAQDWMAANPDKGSEMYGALVSLKLSHLAASVGPSVHPGGTPAKSVPAAAPVATPGNEAKAKLSTPLQDFVMVFKLHGGPVAQNLPLDDLLDASDVAAFNAATPDEKSNVAAAISFYGPHKLKLFMDWVGAQNAKTAAPAAPVPVASQVFYNMNPGHNKFWSVSTHGNAMKTTYGKIGTQGSTTTKDFASPAAASAAAKKLQSEKVAKGYSYAHTGKHEYQGAAASAPAAVKPPLPPTTTSAAAVAAAKPASPTTATVVSTPGWTHQASDVALSGAPSLSAEDASGYTYYVAHTGDAYQVGVIDAEGNPMEHEDFPYPEYAAAQMGQLIMGNNAGLPFPLAADIQKLNPDAGPKDGDTKPGADGGTLVFKNGRWHKVVVKKLKPMEVKALIATKFGSPLSTNDASKAAKKAAGLGDASGIVAAYNDAVAQSWPTTAKKIKLIADAMGVSVDGTPVASAASPTAAAPKPAAAAKPVKATVSAPKLKVASGKPPVTVIDGWAQTGPQKGSNPGGKFKDKSGQEWYCKFPADVDVAMNELLAAKFYQMLGVTVPSLKLVEQNGKIGIASKWVDGISKGTAAQLAKAPGAHQAFALDAWLANWDVVGASNDNLMLDKSGAAVRVDVGGSLVYRAMGDKKGAAFGDTVPELDTLKDAQKNNKSAAVFGGVNDADMAWGLGQLNKLKPSQIEELCQKIGPGSDADKDALAKKLIARRAFILAKMGVRDQWTTVKKLDPTNLPVNPVDLPKPIQFKASSKAHVNAQNTKDSEALIAFAAKGNLTALKDYLYDAVDKETSAPLGKKSILDHPSKPLKEQWAGLVELLQSISTPPMPTLELPSLGSVGGLEDISDFVGTFSPQERVETVAAEHRMHFFMALSHIDDISGLVADMKWSFLKTGSKFVQSAKAKHSSLSSQVKGYISAVQSSGSINHSWSQGKAIVSAGGKSVGIHGLTAKIYAEAQEIPEGTTLIRGMSDTSSGKSMCKQLLACAPGTVIQNTDSMCASYNESHHWGGDVQMTIRCGKGCKATMSFASGNYGNEHEITTLPGQRYVVLSTKKVDNTVHLEVLMLPPHEGFVSELASLSALGKAMSIIFVRGR